MRVFTVPGVFSPRSDSRLLAERIAGAVRAGETVLDPFTGSGILAIAAARAGGLATAIDVSRRAVACARLNARLNGVSLRALRGDMFAPVAGERFDVIAANPPYVPSVNDGAPRGASRAWEAGADGRAFIDRLCREAPGHLAPGGRLFLVHSSICGPADTVAALADAGLETEVVERRRGPLGPLVAERAAALERRGILRTGEREEEMLVFVAVRVGAGVGGRGPGTDAACRLA